MNDTEQSFIKKYWPYLAILFAPPLIKLIGGEDVTTNVLLRLGVIVFCALAYFVGVKVLHLNKSESLPLYASPVVWLGIPVLCVVAYEIIF